MKSVAFLVSVAALMAPVPTAAQRVDLRAGSVVETVAKLRPGEYVWAPEVAPSGPMLLIVNVATQRAVLFRNGVPIGATTVSTGRPGYATPTGVFTILEKHVEHYSRTYDNAPMPFMQRLTWRGVALHAGQLPGYPASHGCIRLPKGFAQRLYGVTSLGMTVVITDHRVTPRLAPTPDLVAGPASNGAAEDGFEWHPDLSPAGPISIVVSAADRRAVVLRNGIVIGSGSVSVDGSVSGTWAYTLRDVGPAGQNWIRLDLGPAAAGGSRVPPEEWQRFHATEAFRRAVAALVVPGTTVIVTPDSVRPGAQPVDIIQEETPARN